MVSFCDPHARRHFGNIRRRGAGRATLVGCSEIGAIKNYETGQIVTRGLFFPLAQYFSRFQIDQMHAGASDALERLMGVIIVGHLIGGPSLHVLAGVGATIEKRPRHPETVAWSLCRTKKGAKRRPKSLPRVVPTGHWMPRSGTLLLPPLMWRRYNDTAGLEFLARMICRMLLAQIHKRKLKAPASLATWAEDP